MPIEKPPEDAAKWNNHIKEILVTAEVSADYSHAFKIWAESVIVNKNKAASEKLV